VGSNGANSELFGKKFTKTAFSKKACKNAHFRKGFLEVPWVFAHFFLKSAT